MPVQIKTGNLARDPLLAGAKQLADAVVATLGPWGRNAAIRRAPGKPPMVTKDGVTVAKSFTALPDPFEDMGAQIVKEAAERTNRIAGDGTTTATLLAYEMMKDGAKLLSEGSNAIHIKRGMDKACTAVIEKLTSMARPVEGLEQFKAIATLSAAGDEEIGSMVAMVIDEVGKDGAVQMEPGMGTGIEYEITSGMQISAGYAWKDFANQKNGSAVLDNPYFLVTTEKITSIRQILPIIEKLKDHDAKGSIVIFSGGVEGDALTTLVTNLPKNVKEEDVEGLESIVMTPPSYGQRQIDVLEDIAVVTGARLIDKKAGKKVEDMSVRDLGRSKSVLVTSHASTISGLPDGGLEARENRKAIIQSALDEAEKDEDKDFLTMRKANITGKIAKIKVGGSSSTEQQEKQHRVEDAICATRAAHETGILPGGGRALEFCHDVIDLNSFLIEGEKMGAEVVQNALSKQFFWVVKNAGYEPTQIFRGFVQRDVSWGFNAETGEFGDMFEMNVIDPAKVPITALKNAVAVAGMFLTLEVVVSEEDVAQK